MVESQPSKLLVAGSIPVSRSSVVLASHWSLVIGPRRSIEKAEFRGPTTDGYARRPTTDDHGLADVAQLAERVLGKDEVTSSILVIGSRESARMTKRPSKIEDRRHGQREIRSQQTARERGHDRAHRPRQDDLDRRAHEGRGRQGLGEVHPLRRGRQGVRVAGPPRRYEDPDHRDQPRRVLDGQSALRPRRLPGPRRLHQEHDHRRRTDGRRDPRRQRGGRPDAADARARAARPPGERALPRRRAQQGGRDRRPRTARPGRARGARAA